MARKDNLTKRWHENRFALNLRMVRREQKLLQKDVGKLIGQECNTISAYEAGKRVPDVLQAVKIANALNVSLDMLCETEYYKLNREKFHNPLEY